jgi:hypothetical protein
LDDCILPELANLRVNAYNQTWLTHPKLHDKGVFKEIGGRVYLNARQLHEKVFKSIIATSSSVVERNVNSGEHREKFDFKINLSTNPPSENIRLKLTEKDDEFSIFHHINVIKVQSSHGQVCGLTKRETIIDVDIVPGSQISFLHTVFFKVLSN